MPSDSQLLPEIVARVAAVLGDNIAFPVPADELDELEFIDVMVSFHTIYRETLSEYVALLSTLNTVLMNTDYHLEEGRRVFDFDETIGRFILDLLLVDDDEYPMRNLIYRISTSIKVIQATSGPILQATFLGDLPTDVVERAVQFMDDMPAFRFTRTCRRYRLMHKPRMYKNAHFRMRYRNNVIQGISEIDTNTLYIDVMNAMVDARMDAVSSLVEYMTKSGTTGHVRFLSFDNEWPRMWPRHVSKQALLQEGTSAEIFDPLYFAVAAAIRDLKLEHVRLVSLALHPRVTLQIAASMTITRLTVERTIATCQIADFAFQLLRKMRNIMHLTLGFGPDVYTHDRVWTALALCQCVQHVYAFSDPITRVGLKYPFYSKELAHVHTLHTLHIHGSNGRLDNLLYWLGAASAERRGTGNLRRFKIHTYDTMPYEDAYWLVSVLGRYHPQLRILVLDGLDIVHPRLFAHVRASLLSLEALCVVRRVSPNMHDARLVDWHHPTYAYAEALHGHPTLQHVEVNMRWDFGDNSMRGIADSDDDTPSLSSASSSTTTDTDVSLPIEPDRAYDGISIAKTFACHLPALQTFAIRNDVTFFSCSLQNHPGSVPRVYDVQAGFPRSAYVDWNPRNGVTWE